MNEAATLQTDRPAADREPGRAQRAHRRGDQRFRRGRATLRPVAGRHRRAHGQRRLDGGDHPRRDPPAGPLDRRRQRQPHPHRRRSRVTNGGSETDLVVAFNEQVLLGRVRAGELKPGGTILLENMWRDDTRSRPSPSAYVRVHDQLKAAGFDVREIPMERECRKHVADPRRGKNMFALGMLCRIYSLDLRARPRADRAHLRQEGGPDRRAERGTAGSRLRLGGREPRPALQHSRRPR